MNFVSSKDTLWAYKEVSPGLANYKVDLIWIYNSDDSIIYSFNTLDRTDYKKSPFGKDELKKITGKEYFSHFFMKMDTCLVEVRVAPIQPSSDIERKSEPRGWFVAAKVWGPQVLKDLNNLTEAEVSIVPLNEHPEEIKLDGDEFIIKRELNKYDGSALKTMYAVFDNDILIDTLLNLYNEKYIAIMIFSIVSILLLLGLLVIWVSRPIKKLSDGLKFRDVKYIERLKNRDNEFGKLANTIVGYFEHEEALNKEIKEHKITLESLVKSETSLKESREYYKHLFEDAHDAIMIIEPENEKIVDVNEQACIMYGYSEEEFKEISLLRLTSGSRNGKELIENTLKYEHLSGYETTHVTKSGGEMNMEINSSVINVKDRKLILTVNRDVTLKKQTEDKVVSSLHEKELLLKEIHHRVKNNLQIISSLLKLQSKYIGDERALDAFKESQNRVKTMALIHERLYRSRDIGKINFHDYVNALISNLEKTYNINRERVDFVIRIEKIELDIDTAIPCSLMINELVSNSFKHAFGGKEKGKVNIQMKSVADDCYELVVSDNGKGIPGDIDFRNTESLGLQLVVTLAEQLEASIDLDRSEGTRFTLRFKKSPF